MAKVTGMCSNCDEHKQCPVWSGIRGLFGAWARERKRQGVDLSAFGEIDQEAMEEATEDPLEKALAAECDCSCHNESQGAKQ